MSSCFNRGGTPRPQDGAWAWLVLVYISLDSVMFGGLFFGYGVILPILMTSLNENRERTALVGSLALGLSVFMCVFASKVCERFTCRVAHGVGSVFAAAGFALSSMCNSVYLLYVTYSLLFGIGASLCYTASFITIRQYFHKHYSMAMGLITAGAGSGTLIIGPAMQSLTDAFGWQNTFRIIAGIFVFALLFVFILDPNVNEPNNNKKNEASHEEALPEEVAIPRKIVLGFLDLSVWKFPEFVIVVVAIFVGSFGHYTAMIHIVKFAEELSVSNGSTLLVFFGSATVVSRLISGRLCDVSFIKPRYVFQVGAILSGVSTILLTLAQNYTHLIIFAVFYGMADGAYRVTLNILFMNTVDSPRKPSAFGQANMVSSVSVSAGPAIAGLLADKMGSYKVAFYMAGSFTILGGVILFIHLFFFKQHDTHHQRVESPELEIKHQDCTEVGDVSDHPFSCTGPGIQIEDEPQTTAF